MSVIRFPGFLALASCIGAAVASGFPLQAADETPADAPGVTVSLNGAAVLHRTPVPYPISARQQGVQGTVVMEATLDAGGNVADARVLAGPQELRRAVLESVLQWHFAPDAANSVRQVGIQFELPLGANQPARGPDFRPAVAVAGMAPAGPLGLRIQSIEILGLPEQARSALSARLPAHVGDVLSFELAQSTGRVVSEFDEHLRMGFVGSNNDATTIQIVAPGYIWQSQPQPPAAPNRIRVGGAVQQAKLSSSVTPDYPPLARQARIQGVVKLTAVIGKDGTVQNLTLISGHPLLVPAALAAVKQWLYQPMLLNGAPTEVETTIDVPFTLTE